MTSPSSSPSESPERRPLREALELIAEQCEEHPLYMPDATEADLEREGGDAASVTYWAQTARKALLARPEGQPLGWVAIQDNCERVLHLSRAHGWRVEEVLTEPAAPQPSTATVITAPSNEGVGPGEVAVAADSLEELATVKKVHAEAISEWAQAVERERLAKEIANRETLSAAYWKDKAEAAQEIANEATLLLEGQGAQSATQETVWGALGDLTREAAKHITKGTDGYAFLCHAQDLLAEDDRRRADNRSTDKGQG